MKNLKIRVNNEDERKEARDLAIQAGYKMDDLFCKNWSDDFCYLLLCGDMSAGFGNEIMSRDDKLISISELRDMVVLKRNDKNDRNVIDPEYDVNLYVDSENNLFVFHTPTQKWKESNLNGEEEVMCRLKPIEKTMKEYINRTTGEYRKTAEKVTGEQWVGIPDGAECLTKHIDITNDTWFVFWKRNYKMCLGYDDTWVNFNLDVNKYLSIWTGRAAILWQRPTQPEELPFVDDEPKSRAAEQINLSAMLHIIERGKTYDSEDGERSAAKTAQAFNAITGHNITEAEVFLLLQLLKDVRQWSRAEYHKDSAEDAISYAVLKAEALENENP